MHPVEYLRTHWQERIPDWLLRFDPRKPFDRAAFFSSRVIYYPGCGTDGQPVQLFGGASAAHCFVYVDSGMEADVMAAELAAHPFRGYDLLEKVRLSSEDLAPNGWRPVERLPNVFPTIKPYGFLQVLQRQTGYGPEYGPERLAVLFLGAEGVAAYDAIFCQAAVRTPEPFAVVAQNHGSPTYFGGGEILERVAMRALTMPELLLVGISNTVPWQGYEAVEDVETVYGGALSHVRQLFRRAG
jgi:hypothetical protein